MSNSLNPFVSASAPSALQPGAMIGQKYRVDGLLGWGGMGVVLRATHLELDAPVAIKVVREELAQREEVVSRLLFEARAAAKLRGRHIVRVSDVARLESGAPYIVMELLEGEDLATILEERGALPVHEAVEYVIQACEGLAEAHALGLVHRDLKPENLFIASTPEGGVLKILDFGISKAVEGSLSCTPRTTLTSAGNAVGSPYYMSPEQMRASRDVDARADIWSLGAILFELLTGRCAFDGDSIPSVCAKVLEAERAELGGLASDVPAPLEQIIDLCLRKDAIDRFQNVDELAAALCAFVEGDGRPPADASWRLASGINLRNSRASVASMRALARGRARAPRRAWTSRRVVPAALATLLIGGALTGWQLSQSPRSAGSGWPIAAADPATTPRLPITTVAAAPGAPSDADIDTAALAKPAEPPAQPLASTQANGVNAKPWPRPQPAATPPPRKPVTGTTSSSTSVAEPKNPPPSDAWNVETWGGRY